MTPRLNMSPTLSPEEVSAFQSLSPEVQNQIINAQMGSGTVDVAVPTPIASTTPTNMFAGLGDSMAQIYSSKIAQTQDELIRTGQQYMGAYEAATPNVNFGWGELVQSLFPMLIGGVMGQPMAGIAASNDVEKSIAARAEAERLAAAQNPMLRFLAERQGQLQSQLGTLQNGQMVAQRQAELNKVKQDQAAENMMTMDTLARDRSMDLMRERERLSDLDVADQRKYSEEQDRIAREEELKFYEKKQEFKKTLDTPTMEAEIARYSKPGVVIKDPTKLPRTAGEMGDFRDLNTRVGKAAMAYGVATQLADYMDAVQRGEVNDSIAEINRKIRRGMGRASLFIKNDEKFGSAYSANEQSLSESQIGFPDPVAKGFMGTAKELLISKGLSPIFQEQINSVRDFARDLQTVASVEIAPDMGAEIDLGVLGNRVPSFYDKEPSRNSGATRAASRIFGGG